MKYFLLISVLSLPALASAGGHSDMGSQICREEVGPDPMAQQQCLREWQQATYFVVRYYQHAGMINDQYEPESFMSIFKIDNPFVLSPRRVINICATSQVYNGNLFSGFMDFREMWECISDIDPVAASWDTI